MIFIPLILSLSLSRARVSPIRFIFLVRDSEILSFTTCKYKWSFETGQERTIVRNGPAGGNKIPRIHRDALQWIRSETRHSPAVRAGSIRVIAAGYRVAAFQRTSRSTTSMILGTRQSDDNREMRHESAA